VLAACFRIVDFHLRTRNHRGGGIGNRAPDGPAIALLKNCPDDRKIAQRNFIG
jgi:hypothetical protein